jgi:hypothetical protein
MARDTDKPIVPQPGTVQARVLALFLCGETEVGRMCQSSGFGNNQLRKAIDALRGRGWDIESLGKCHFRLNVQSKAA